MIADDFIPYSAKAKRLLPATQGIIDRLSTNFLLSARGTALDYCLIQHQLAQVRWALACSPEWLRLLPYLQYQGSLTYQLQQIAPRNSLEVVVLQERMVDQSHWEREVLLCLDHEAWVWAQSQIPRTLRAQPLGNQALGTWLFSCQPPVRRSVFHFGELRMNQNLKLPLRRSQLSFQHLAESIKVVECFLPPAWQNLQLQSASQASL